MWRTVVFYGVVLAAAAIALQWVQYRLWVRAHSSELYIALLAAGFLALGIWVGVRLVHRRDPDTAFSVNEAALASLGISPRELEVLRHLAAGCSNKEIANALAVSPNTVKTHLARLYEKLEAARRTEAILKARDLGLIP